MVQWQSPGQGPENVPKTVGDPAPDTGPETIDDDAGIQAEQDPTYEAFTVGRSGGPTPRRRETPIRRVNGQQEGKGLLEKYFPSIYSLWKVVRKPKVAPSQEPSAPQIPPPEGQGSSFEALAPPVVQEPFAPVQEIPLPSQPPPTPAEQSLAQQLDALEAPHDQTIRGPAQTAPTTILGVPLRDDDDHVLTESLADLAPSSIELEETTEKAREELRQIHRIRDEADEVRARGRDELDDADSLQEDAERIMGEARSVFSKAMALNPDALRSMATTIRNLEEAIRTERQLRYQTRQDTEMEAESSKQRATEALLNALSAVRKASNYVHRELDEARRVAETAKSLKGASQDDFRRAEAMMAQAESLIRQEARRLLDEPTSRRARPSRSRSSASDPGIDESIDAEPEISHARKRRTNETPRTQEAQSTLPASRPQGQVPSKPADVVEGSSGVDQQASPPRSDLSPSQETPLRQQSGQPSPRGPAGGEPSRSSDVEVAKTWDLDAALQEFVASAGDQEAPRIADEPLAAPSDGLFLDNLDFSRLEPSTAIPQAPATAVPTPPPPAAARAQTPSPPQESLSEVQTPVAAPSSQPSEERSRAPTSGASEEFGGDLLAQLQESLTQIRTEDGPAGLPMNDMMEEMPVYSPGRSQASAELPTQAYLTEPPLTTAPPQRMPIPDAGRGMDELSVGSSGQEALVTASGGSSSVAASYSGILYIVFSPAADAATLSFFWDVVDTVAGVGKVVAQTPLSDGSGHEFTLDLGNDQLVIEQLQKRIPGAQVAALGPDRLSIQLAPLAD